MSFANQKNQFSDARAVSRNFVSCLKDSGFDRLEFRTKQRIA